MDCLIPLLKGTQNVCKQDLKEITGKEPTIGKEFCLIKKTTTQEVAKLAYQLQSGISVLPLIAKGKKAESVKLSDKNLLKACMQEGMTYAVQSIKDKDEKLSSEEIHIAIGEQIGSWLREIEINPQVSLNNPDIVFTVVATGEEFFVGIEVIGFKLCKRPYKLFQHPASLNPCIAYVIAKETGLTKNNVVVDPCCGTGTIVIEASLYQQTMSPFHFENKFAGLKIPFFKDAFKEVEQKEKTKKAKKSKVFGFDAQVKMMIGARKNAKIAGIKESVSFSKVTLDWLDAKFKEGEVDSIITQPPIISQRIRNEKEVLKLYDELCHQAKYILKKKGSMGVFINKPEKFKEIATKHNWSFKKELAIPIGDSVFTLLVYSR